MNAETKSLMNQNDPVQSAPDSHLLRTLLSQEDQLQHHRLRHTHLSHHILHILHQLTSLLHLDASTLWMTMDLLKSLIIHQHPIDLITIIASLTLSHKYQHAQSHTIDYHLIQQSCHIHNIQLIHDAEITLLDVLSYDICVTTPDHFFSHLSSLTNNDHTLQQIIQQARSSFSFDSLSHHTLGLLHNYPSSIVALSLLVTITSNTFIIDQIKSVLLHKKDPSHYLTQLLHCTAQLQSHSS